MNGCRYLYSLSVDTDKKSPSEVLLHDRHLVHKQDPVQDVLEAVPPSEEYDLVYYFHSA